MVATGHPRSDQCQVFDMSSSASTCSNLPSYPLPMSLGAGGIVNGSPILCGGYTSGSPPQTDKCYRFEKITNSWELHCNLKSKRSHHASTVMEGSLFITGGIKVTGFDMASTEFLYTDGTTQSGPDMPKARHAHCMVTLPSGKVMILGGHGSSLARDLFMFDPDDNTFTSGPSLTYDRVHFACAIFISPQHNNRPVVLAAGGNFQATAELYDYTNANAWESSICLIFF